MSDAFNRRVAKRVLVAAAVALTTAVATGSWIVTTGSPTVGCAPPPVEPIRVTLEPRIPPIPFPVWSLASNGRAMYVGTELGLWRMEVDDLSWSRIELGSSLSLHDARVSCLASTRTDLYLGVTGLRRLTSVRAPGCDTVVLHVHEGVARALEILPPSRPPVNGPTIAHLLLLDSAQVAASTTTGVVVVGDGYLSWEFDIGQSWRRVDQPTDLERAAALWFEGNDLLLSYAQDGHAYRYAAARSGFPRRSIRIEPRNSEIATTDASGTHWFLENVRLDSAELASSNGRRTAIRWDMRATCRIIVAATADGDCAAVACIGSQYTQLFRASADCLQPIAVPAPLASAQVTSVCALPGDAIAVGTWDRGVWIIKDGKTHVFGWKE